MNITGVALRDTNIGLLISILVTTLVLRIAIQRTKENARLKQLGSRGPQIKTKWPLGFDFMYQSVKAIRAHKYMQFWRDELFKPLNSWTVEARVANQRAIFTADPENIKAILATQFADYGKGKPFHDVWKEFLGDSIFATDGQLWSNSRKLIRPHFNRDRVSDLECIEERIGTLLRAIANGGALDSENQEVDVRRANGKQVEISDILYRFTLDVATQFLLGCDVQSLTTPKQCFAEAFGEAQRIQYFLARANRIGMLIPKAKFRSNLEIINSFINQFIDKALALPPEDLNEKAKSDKNFTFLHALASVTKDRTVLRDQILAILIAGRDTTASTLSWTLYELGRHPRCVAKLRREIMEFIGPTELPTYEHLKNMPYLKAVLNEVLRLYPVIPFNVRMALNDTTLPRGGGKDGTEPLPVLKDTPIGYSTLVMHRREDLYPPVSDTFADPSIFSPERWSHWHPKPHQYIPFNAGPRICLGQNFALTEMEYVLCRLFQRFKSVTSHMQAIDGGEPCLQTAITLSPGQGVFISFEE